MAKEFSMVSSMTCSTPNTKSDPVIDFVVLRVNA